jgi:hypothetical protein
MSHRPMTNTSSLKIAAAYWLYLMKYSRVNQAMQTVSMSARVGLSIGFPFASCTDITKIDKDRKMAPPPSGEYLKIE